MTAEQSLQQRALDAVAGIARRRADGEVDDAAFRGALATILRACASAVECDAVDDAVDDFSAGRDVGASLRGVPFAAPLCAQFAAAAVLHACAAAAAGAESAARLTMMTYHCAVDATSLSANPQAVFMAACSEAFACHVVAATSL